VANAEHHVLGFEGHCRRTNERKVKFFNQTAMWHGLLLQQEFKLKFLSCLDGYLAAVDSENPVLVYLSARYLLELMATIAYLDSHLLLSVRDALRSDVPNHRLSTLTDMDVLDADILIAAMTLPAKSLDLPRIGAQQPSRSRRKRHHPPVSAAATSESRKNRKGRGVCAGHLNGESSFDFILWRGSLDQGKGGVHTDFRNPAAGQSSRRLQLK